MTAGATGRKTRPVDPTPGRRRWIAVGLILVLTLGCWWLSSRSSAAAIGVASPGARNADALSIEAQRAGIETGTDSTVPERREVEPAAITGGVELFGHFNLPVGIRGSDPSPLTLTLYRLDLLHSPPPVLLVVEGFEYSVSGLSPGSYRV